MEADGEPFTPLPLSVLRFAGIQSYGYTDQRKVEQTWRSLSLRKPRTSQLSHDCSSNRISQRSIVHYSKGWFSYNRRYRFDRLDRLQPPRRSEATQAIGSDKGVLI